MLVDHILRLAPFEHGVKGVTPDVMKLLESYHWPGNVRELKNTLLRAIPFCDGALVDLHALPDALRSEGVAPPAPGEETPENGSGTHLRLPTADLSLKEARDQLMDAFERKYLEDLLERTNGNLTRAAHMAGVDRKTIARLVKRHGIGG
jgi:DNA-binding NtrC family response regulator